MLTEKFEDWVEGFVRIEPDHLGQPDWVRLDHPRGSVAALLTREEAESLADRIRAAAGMILPPGERFRGAGMGIEAGDF